MDNAGSTTEDHLNSRSRTPAGPAASAESAGAGLPELDEQAWRQLDATMRSWWDADVSRATEAELRATTDGDTPGGTLQRPELLFLPFPYLTPGGGEGSFAAMFAWDADFTSWGVLAHGRLELVRDHISNYLFMIQRYGYMPNANHAALVTRSQTPVFATTVWRYYLASQDADLLEQAYPLLKRNYWHYWNAPHHQTPTGLATNRDLGDPNWPPELAAEAETGWDWTPIYGADVRRCVPLITNCALVRYARVLALMATELGRDADAARFEEEATERAELIRRYCWNDSVGMFVEYDYVAAEQLPYMSDCAYWTLWAGVASPEQARRLVENLHLLERPYGMACTDQAYPDPHPDIYPGVSSEPDPHVPADMLGGQGQLQWMYPAGWAPEHVIAVEGLDAYNYPEEATRLSARFLAAIVEQYQKTGKLWEKYNVVDGSLVLPNSRYGSVPLRGWTAAAAVLLGRRLFHDETFDIRP